MNRLDKIEARANAATEGPWEWEGKSDEMWPQGENSLMATGGAEPEYVLMAWGYDAYGITAECDADAEFIAHARTDVPWLLEQVERRDKALEAVLDLHKEDGHGWGPGESFCTECQQGYGLLVPYPCPTVTAIRQHLGDDL